MWPRKRLAIRVAASRAYRPSATAPVTLLDGTGLYKGITGTVNVTIIEAAILPRFASGKHKGQCNTGNNAKPIAIWGSVDGSGTVQFG